MIKETGLLWQPIKTAPKDGTAIIIRDSVGGIHGAKWTTYQGRTDWFHHTNMGWLPSASYWIPIPTMKGLNNV